jgi:hypothetical protein
MGTSVYVYADSFFDSICSYSGSRDPDVPTGYFLFWPLPFDFSRMAAPASSRDTSGTALSTIRSTQALSPRQGEQPNGNAVNRRL